MVTYLKWKYLHETDEINVHATNLTFERNVLTFYFSRVGKNDFFLLKFYCFILKNKILDIDNEPSHSLVVCRLWGGIRIQADTIS